MDGCGWILLLIVCPTLGLEGFDCEQSQLVGFNSILSSNDCLLAEKSTMHEVVTSGVVVQQVLSEDNVSKVCRRLKARRTVYCNWMIVAENKMDPINLQGFVGDPLPPHDCLQLFRDGTFQLGRDLVSVKRGIPFTYTDTNKLTTDGLCKAWHGAVDYNTFLVWFDYRNVTLLSGMDAHVSTYVVEGDTIERADGEHTGKTTSGYTAIWEETTTTDCFLREVYRGNMTLITEGGPARQVLVPQRGVGMSLHKKITLCNVELYTTNIPFIFLIDGVNVRFPNLSQPQGVELYAETKALIQGLFLTTSLGLERSSTEIRTSLCALEQKMNRDVLYGVMLDPDLTAYKQLGVRGWRMIRSGAAVGLLSCKRVMVKVDPQEQCHLDIPVSVEGLNTTHFLDPVTHVIHSTSLVIPCEDPRIPLFLVDDIWYKIGTMINKVPPPSAFSSSLVQRTPIVLMEGRGLASDELVTKKIVRLSLDAARRRGELQMIAEQDESITGVDQGTPIRIMTPLQHEERSMIHYRNVIALTSPLVLISVLGGLIYGFRSFLFNKLLTTAVPEIGTLRQYLPIENGSPA